MSQPKSECEALRESIIEVIEKSELTVEEVIGCLDLLKSSLVMNEQLSRVDFMRTINGT